MDIKVCGMRDKENIRQLVALSPNYIGYIFFPKSKRYVGENPPAEIFEDIPSSIKKVGVFVNETPETVISICKKHKLDVAQLHGSESPETCKLVQSEQIEVVKVFSVDDDFDFNTLSPYLPVCSYFLFDTKCKEYGGSGQKFNWEILKKYPFEKTFFLSGGIDAEDTNIIKDTTDLPVCALDLNSRFEVSPALKNIELLKEYFASIKASE